MHEVRVPSADLQFFSYISTGHIRSPHASQMTVDISVPNCDSTWTWCDPTSPSMSADRLCSRRRKVCTRMCAKHSKVPSQATPCCAPCVRIPSASKRHENTRVRRNDTEEEEEKEEFGPEHDCVACVLGRSLGACVRGDIRQIESNWIPGNPQSMLARLGTYMCHVDNFLFAEEGQCLLAWGRGDGEECK